MEEKTENEICQIFSKLYEILQTYSKGLRLPIIQVEIHFSTLQNLCIGLHTFTSKGKSVQKLTLGIISFPVAPLRYLLKIIPPTTYTTSKEIKLERKKKEKMKFPFKS